MNGIKIFSIMQKNRNYAFSTPFDESAVELLENLGAPAYKLASFEITDIPLIKTIAETNKPILMSTGMATLEEIGAVEAINSSGNHKIVLLHCISSYPASLESANLQNISILRENLNLDVGLSDHTWVPRLQ